MLDRQCEDHEFEVPADMLGFMQKQLDRISEVGLDWSPQHQNKASEISVAMDHTAELMATLTHVTDHPFRSESAEVEFGSSIDEKRGPITTLSVKMSQSLPEQGDTMGQIAGLLRISNQYRDIMNLLLATVNGLEAAAELKEAHEVLDGFDGQHGLDANAVKADIQKVIDAANRIKENPGAVLTTEEGKRLLEDLVSTNFSFDGEKLGSVNETLLFFRKKRDNLERVIGYMNTHAEYKFNYHLTMRHFG